MPETAKLEQVVDGIAVTDTPIESEYGLISRNPQKILDILAAVGKDISQATIAADHGISQSCVSKVIAKYRPKDKLAVLRAQALSLPAVESLWRAAKNGEAKGKHGAQATLLQAAGILKSGSEGHTLNQQIVIGMPGLPAHLPPVIDLSPTPFASDAPE